MIELLNVTKYYPTEFGKHYVFRNVTLKLPLHINVAVIGPNGAGKSTFLRLLGGSDIPSDGRILKSGRISPPMGLTPGLQATMTGSENTRFACRIYGMSREEINENIDKVRGLADIGKFFDMPVRTYSAGMRQRLAFAVSMSMHFDYYLFDEVGAGGDASFRHNAKKMVEERLATSNFIIASHRLDDMLDLCQAGILIKDGELTYFDDVADALSAYRLDLDDGAEDQPARKARDRRRGREAAETDAATPQGDALPAAAPVVPLSPEEKAAVRLERRRHNRALKAAAAAQLQAETAAAAPPPAPVRAVRPAPVPLAQPTPLTPLPKPPLQAAIEELRAVRAAPVPIAGPTPIGTPPQRPPLQSAIEELRALLSAPLPSARPVAASPPQPPAAMPVSIPVHEPAKPAPRITAAAAPPPPALHMPTVAAEKPAEPMPALNRASIVQAIAAGKSARALRILQKLLESPPDAEGVSRNAALVESAIAAQAKAAEAAALSRAVFDALTSTVVAVSRPRAERPVKVRPAPRKSVHEKPPKDAAPQERRRIRRQRRQVQLSTTS